ncbi:putative Dynamin family protein [Candidatus Sulfopaludibacter sp. SbA3]|nr:putative Dynamin family protein [Candidatus Sulfopaludibacter sp. SbA3]
MGAVPVTAMITEMEYGRRDRAEVVFQKGTTEEIPPACLGEFVSEAGNPGNFRQVVRVRLYLQAMERYRALRFVDTPGLESVLEHNTEASLRWLPNVGLALVAVGVDPPLSRHDMELIRTLSRYTPNISVLLTKIDLLEDADRLEVREFVRTQLARFTGVPLPLFCYSTRPGFEGLRAELDEQLLCQTGGQRDAILRHKLDSLLRECSQYLKIAGKAAEITDSERAAVRRAIRDETNIVDESRQSLRLAARHAAEGTRGEFELLLQSEEAAVRDRLLAELDAEFPSWTASLAIAAERFEAWLCGAAAREMSCLSERHRSEFVASIGRVSRRLAQSLQDFRNRLSEGSLRTLGVPLEASEMELRVKEPQSPDVRLGRIFDRNWELLSFLLPMAPIRALLKRHFQWKVADVVSMNLSRLTTQWADAVNGAIFALEKQAIDRLDGLTATIQALLAAAGTESGQICADLRRVEEQRERLLSHNMG